MEKLVVAAWREPGTEPDGIAAAITAAGRALAADGRWVTVATEDPRAADMLLPAASDSLVLTGMVTVWVDTVEEADDLPGIDAARTATYLVTESVPLAYHDRVWEDGTPSPGVSLLTAIRRHDGLDDATFFDRWHGSHAVLTLQVHPVTRYVRNAVVRPLTPDAPAVDGFVQDGFATYDDLLDPERMYGAGAPEVPWEEGMRRVAEDIDTFLDLDATAAVPTTETILRAAPWERGAGRPSPIPVASPAGS